MIGPSQAVFYAFEPNGIIFKTTPASGAINFQTAFVSPLPAWLTFTDHHNGTATLGGIPPTTAVQQHYTMQIIPHAFGSACSIVDPLNRSNFTLTVAAPPAFLSQPQDLLFFTGKSSNTSISTSFPASMSEIGTLPSSIAFNSGTFTATNPAPGSGGVFPVTVTAHTDLDTETAALNVYLADPPVITSANSAQFAVGTASNPGNTFTVTTTGFPKFPVTASNNTDVNNAGISITVTGNLPTGVTFSSTTSSGENTGTGIFSGTPLPGTQGMFPLTITAHSPLFPGQDSVQHFTMNVISPGDVNRDSAVNCLDVNVVKAALGTYRNRPGFDPRADVNNDGLINVVDLASVSSHLQAGTVCH